jgi:hypothetical protein
MDRLVPMPMVCVSNIQTNIFEGSDQYACLIEIYDRYATKPCPAADHCGHCPEHPGMDHGTGAGFPRQVVAGSSLADPFLISLHTAGALYPKGEALLHSRGGAPSGASPNISLRGKKLAKFLR